MVKLTPEEIEFGGRPQLSGKAWTDEARAAALAARQRGGGKKPDAIVNNRAYAQLMKLPNRSIVSRDATAASRDAMLAILNNGKNSRNALNAHKHARRLHGEAMSRSLGNPILRDLHADMVRMHAQEVDKISKLKKLG